MATLPDLSLFSAPPQPFVSLDMLFPPPEMPPTLAAPAPSSSSLQLTEDQQHQLLLQLRAHYDEALRARDQLTRKREERYRRYLADVALRTGLQAWDDAPQLFIPLTRRTIETLKDEFVEAIGSVESLLAHGIGDEDVKNAERQTQFLRHALQDINPEVWEELIDAGIHDALQDSLGLYKIYPYKEPFPEPMADGQLLETIIRWDRVDEGTMLFPPNHTGFQWPECAYIAQQLWVSPDEFPSMRDRGFTLPDAESFEAQGDTSRQYTDDERKRLEFARQGLNPDEASLTYDPRVEMVESYELFAFTPDQPRAFVVVHWFPHLRSLGGSPAGGQIVRCLRLQEAMRQNVFARPMWPFMPLTVWPQPGQARGMNVPERLESAQDLLNRLTEQMVEQGEANIVPLIFANLALSGDLPNLRRVKPGDVIPLDTMGSVTVVPGRSENRHFIEQMQIARQWAEEDTGATANVQGRNQEQATPAQRTLGGMALQLQQSQKGFKKQTHHLARQLRQAVKLYLGLWQGHVQPHVTFSVPDTAALQARLFSGGDAEAPRTQVTIDAETWRGGFDITVKVNPEAHLEQQKILMMAEKLDGILAPVYPLGRRELWKMIWSKLGLQEFERFYPEQVAVVQTQILLLQAQIQMAAMEAQLMQMSMPQLPGLPGEQAAAPGASPATGGQAPDMQMVLAALRQMLQGGAAPTGEDAGGLPPMPTPEMNPMAVGGV